MRTPDTQIFSPLGRLSVEIGFYQFGQKQWLTKRVTLHERCSGDLKPVTLSNSHM